jgi:tetratricopeptide (TPR) repeat protein
MSAESTTGAAPQPVRRTVDVVLAVIVVAALLLTSFAVVLGEYLRDRTGSEFYLVIPLVVFFASPVALIFFGVRLALFWRRLDTRARLVRLAFPAVIVLGCVLAQSQRLFHRYDAAVHSWTRPQQTVPDFLDAARLATESGEDNERAAVGHDLLALPFLFGKPADAETHYRKSLAIRERLYGPVHPRVAFSLRNLATVLSMQRRFEEAAAALNRALDIQEGDSGPDSDAVADILSEYADVLREMNQSERAATLQARAKAIRDKAQEIRP